MAPPNLDLNPDAASFEDFGDDPAAPLVGRDTVSFYDQPHVCLVLFRSTLRLTTLCDEHNCRIANCGKINGPVRVVHGRPIRAAGPGGGLGREVVFARPAPYVHLPAWQA